MAYNSDRYKEKDRKGKQRQERMCNYFSYSYPRLDTVRTCAQDCAKSFIETMGFSKGFKEVRDEASCRKTRAKKQIFLKAQCAFGRLQVMKLKEGSRSVEVQELRGREAQGHGGL